MPGMTMFKPTMTMTKPGMMNIGGPGGITMFRPGMPFMPWTMPGLPGTMRMNGTKLPTMTVVLKLVSKWDARNELLNNLTIGDPKLANKSVEALEEDGEALEAIEAMEEVNSTIGDLKLANKLDARRDLLNLTIGDLKLANKFPEAMEEDGEAFGILAIEAMEEASSTIGDLKLANKLD